MKIRKGDEVEIMRGAFRKKRGIISVINRKNMKILIENIKIKKGSGQETEAAIDPSNVKIIKLSEDKKRKTQ